jgi:hypothetical protein
MNHGVVYRDLEILLARQRRLGCAFLLHENPERKLELFRAPMEKLMLTKIPPLKLLAFEGDSTGTWF